MSQPIGYEDLIEPEATAPTLILMCQHLFVETEEYVLAIHRFGGNTKLVFTNLRIALLEEDIGGVTYRFVPYRTVIGFSVNLRKSVQLGTLEILLSSGEMIQLSSNDVREVLSAQQSLAKYLLKGPSLDRIGKFEEFRS
ncbi:MAG: hypothetical protein EI684_10455 [Candidatus Viridilinea halotolerans]|uniref:Bacterial Pleckstrin homology domain-containing protein n=1 Tax=Candidatus Viridilinea halotolerans TaxID=2491704 RepID=A0A426U024_9CHLR|nr:MAG: hypothetical protein EI684_10455 [Candidatus Viridilinea halotolerans]